MNWIDHASQFAFPHYADINGEKLQSDIFYLEIRAKKTWAVLINGLILDKISNKFVYESMSSETADEFKSRTRSASKEEAYETLQNYLAEYVRLQGGWLKKE